MAWSQNFFKFVHATQITKLVYFLTHKNKLDI